MIFETLAAESNEIFATGQAADHELEQTMQIAPLAQESFKLIGGGSSIVVLG